MQLHGSAPQAPVIRNVHVTSHLPTEHAGVTSLRTTFVPFGDIDDYYGGDVTTATIVDGRITGMRLRAFVNRPEERMAAQALHDAITASGLLEMELPANDWKHPSVGRTRLYVDRRSRFLEFDTAAPPAIVQGVLGALAAYERSARARGLAA